MMKKWLTLPAVLAVGGLLLLRPQAAAQAVREGLALCAGTVIPSLFPFFVVVSLLLQLGLAETLQGLCGPFMGPLFRMRGVCALPLLAGLLGGYPAGARTAAELFQQGRLSRREAELLLGFCDNCGPAFLLGYVGAGTPGRGRTCTCSTFSPLCWRGWSSAACVPAGTRPCRAGGRRPEASPSPRLSPPPAAGR